MKPTVANLLAQAQSWRHHYNPLRGLTMARVASLYDEMETGIYANGQWLWRFVEKRDATTRALRRLRLGALRRMPWSIRTVDTRELSPSEKKLAERQKAALQMAYERIDNLTKAVGALASAEFRGFAHLEKHRDAQGHITHLEPVPQWHWLRPRGEWLYDASAQASSSGVTIDPTDFIIREVPDPIDEIAGICFVRKNMSVKDFDAFIETFGIPSIFVILPPNTPDEKVKEYQATADAMTANGRGAMPHGSDIKTVGEKDAGAPPFLPHIRYQDEQIVMAGTAGKLKMLVESGTGTLAGGAQDKTFDDLAADEGQECSECFQLGVDVEVLDRETPGEPRLAYFSLAHEDQDDADAKVERVTKLAQVGYRLVDADAFGKEVGLQLVDAGPAPAPTAPTAQARNARAPRTAAVTIDRRATMLAAAKAWQAQSKPVAVELARVLRLAEREDFSDDELVQALNGLRERLPDLAQEMAEVGAFDELLKKVQGTALAAGLADAQQETPHARK